MRFIILPILILCLALAACGGDDTGKKFASDVNTIQTDTSNTINAQAASGHLNAGVVATSVDQAANRIAALKAPKNAASARTSLVGTLHSFAAALRNNSEPTALKNSTDAYAAQVSEEIKSLNRSF